MISEEQLFDAKVFLRSYCDAIQCVEQCAIKDRVFNIFKINYISIHQGENEEMRKQSLKLFNFTR